MSASTLTATQRSEPDLRLNGVGFWLPDTQRSPQPTLFLGKAPPRSFDSGPPYCVSGNIVAVTIVVLIKYSSDDLLVRHIVDRKCAFAIFPIILSISCLIFLGRAGVTEDNSVLTERESKGKRSLKVGECGSIRLRRKLSSREPTLISCPLPTPSALETGCLPVPRGGLPGQRMEAQPVVTGAVVPGASLRTPKRTRNERFPLQHNQQDLMGDGRTRRQKAPSFLEASAHNLFCFAIKLQIVHHQGKEHTNKKPNHSLVVQRPVARAPKCQ